MTAAERIPGVMAVRLAPLDGLLYVRYDPDATNAEMVTTAVDAAIDAVAR